MSEERREERGWLQGVADFFWDQNEPFREDLNAAKKYLAKSREFLAAHNFPQAAQWEQLAYEAAQQEFQTYSDYQRESLDHATALAEGTQTIGNTLFSLGVTGALGIAAFPGVLRWAGQGPGTAFFGWAVASLGGGAGLALASSLKQGVYRPLGVPELSEEDFWKTFREGVNLSSFQCFAPFAGVLGMTWGQNYRGVAQRLIQLIPFSILQSGHGATQAVIEGGNKLQVGTAAGVGALLPFFFFGMEKMFSLPRAIQDRLARKQGIELFQGLVFPEGSSLEAAVAVAQKKLGLSDLEIRDPEAIKLKFKDAALRQHPDRGGDPEAFTELNALKSILLREVCGVKPGSAFDHLIDHTLADDYLAGKLKFSSIQVAKPLPMDVVDSEFYVRVAEGFIVPVPDGQPLASSGGVWKVRSVGHDRILLSGAKGERSFKPIWGLGVRAPIQAGDRVLFKPGVSGGSGSEGDVKRLNQIFLKAYVGETGAFEELVQHARSSPVALDYLIRLAVNGHPDAVSQGLLAVQRENPEAGFALVDLARKNNRDAWAAMKKLDVKYFVLKAREEWRLYVKSLSRAGTPLAPAALEDTDRFSLIEEWNRSSIGGIEALKLAAQAGNDSAYAALSEEGFLNFQAVTALAELALKDARALDGLSWLAERNREALDALLRLLPENPAALDSIRYLDLKRLLDAAKNDPLALANYARLMPYRTEVRGKLSLFPVIQLARAADQDREALKVFCRAFRGGDAWIGKILKKVNAMALGEKTQQDPLAFFLLSDMSAAGNHRATSILKKLDPYVLSLLEEENAKPNLSTSPIPDEYYEFFSTDPRMPNGILVPLKAVDQAPGWGETWEVKSLVGDTVTLQRSKQGPTAEEKILRLVPGKSGTLQLKSGKAVALIASVRGGSGDDSSTRPFQQISAEEKQQLLELYQKHPGLRAQMDESGWTLRDKRDFFALLLATAHSPELALRNLPAAFHGLLKAGWSYEHQSLLLATLAQKAKDNVAWAYGSLPLILMQMRSTNWTEEEQFHVLHLLAEKTGMQVGQSFDSLRQSIRALEITRWDHDTKYRFLKLLAERSGNVVGTSFDGLPATLEELKELGWGFHDHLPFLTFLVENAGHRPPFVRDPAVRRVIHFNPAQRPSLPPGELQPWREFYPVKSIEGREPSQGLLIPVRSAQSFPRGVELWEVNSAESDRVILSDGKEIGKRNLQRLLHGQRVLRSLQGIYFLLRCGDRVVFWPSPADGGEGGWWKNLVGSLGRFFGGSESKAVGEFSTKSLLGAIRESPLQDVAPPPPWTLRPLVQNKDLELAQKILTRHGHRPALSDAFMSEYLSPWESRQGSARHSGQHVSLLPSVSGGSGNGPYFEKAKELREALSGVSDYENLRPILEAYLDNAKKIPEHDPRLLEEAAALRELYLLGSPWLTVSKAYSAVMQKFAPNSDPVYAEAEALRGFFRPEDRPDYPALEQRIESRHIISSHRLTILRHAFIELYGELSQKFDPQHPELFQGAKELRGLFTHSNPTTRFVALKAYAALVPRLSKGHPELLEGEKAVKKLLNGKLDNMEAQARETYRLISQKLARGLAGMLELFKNKLAPMVSIALWSKTEPSYFNVVSTVPGDALSGILIPSNAPPQPSPVAEAWEVRSVVGNLVFLCNGVRVGQEGVIKPLQGERTFKIIKWKGELLPFQPGDQVTFLPGVSGASGRIALHPYSAEVEKLNRGVLSGERSAISTGKVYYHREYESIGGNAGAGRFAVNALVDPKTGQIKAVGNPQNIPSGIKDRYTRVTFLVRIPALREILESFGRIQPVQEVVEVFAPDQSPELQDFLNKHVGSRFDWMEPIPLQLPEDLLKELGEDFDRARNGEMQGLIRLDDRLFPHSLNEALNELEAGNQVSEKNLKIVAAALQIVRLALDSEVSPVRANLVRRCYLKKNPLLERILQSLPTNPDLLTIARQLGWEV